MIGVALSRPEMCAEGTTGIAQFKRSTFDFCVDFADEIIVCLYDDRSFIALCKVDSAFTTPYTLSKLPTDRSSVTIFPEPKFDILPQAVIATARIRMRIVFFIVLLL